jgi:hypothetical protein
MSVISALDWVTVDSGLFAAAAYREQPRQLYLRFRDGDVYRYFDCPLPVYNEFLTAESKGKYFSQKIRNRFRHELVYSKAASDNEDESINACLEEQLSSSVALAKTRAVQKREAAQAAGVQDGIR